MTESMKKSIGKNVYDYLKWCSTHRHLRGVGVITDIQYIFYTQSEKDDYGTHNDIVIDIENTIHPWNVKRGWDAYRENDLYFYSVGDDFIIDLPNDNTLSMNQYKYLCGVLDEVDKFNSEVPDNKKIQIDVHSNLKEYFNEYKLLDIQKIKDQLLEMITRDIKLEHQVIIGKTLSEEEIKQAMQFHIDMKDNMTLDELHRMLGMCKKYFSCANYHDIFLKIFPNYEQVLELVEVLYKLNNDGTLLFKGVSFENISDIIKNNIISIFSKKLDYEQIVDIFYDINTIKNLQLVSDIFPNFCLMFECMHNTYLDSNEKNEINSLLVNSKTYDDKMRIIVNYFYRKIDRELFDVKEKRKQIDSDFEYIDVGKRIIANKEVLNSLIERYNELSESNLKLDFQMIDIKYRNDRNNEDIISYKDKLKNYSNGLFRKIFNRKQIKECNNVLEQLSNKSNSLSETTSKCNDEKTKNMSELSDIEKQFKEITGFDYMVFDIESMNYYYDRDFSDAEEIYNDSIKYTDIEILELEKKMRLLESTGLIDLQKGENMKR